MFSRSKRRSGSRTAVSGPETGKNDFFNHKDFLIDVWAYCLERELNRTFLYTIRGKKNPRKYTKTLKQVFCRAMRAAKNLSKKCFVGPCAQLKTFQKYVL